ncbi:MAG: hypothetical protein AB8G15_15850 [Saprospiraceae bacterium]
MRTTIFLFLLFLSFYQFSATQAKPNYWVETTPLDSLVLIHGAERKPLIGNSDNTQFNIFLTDNTGYYLKPYCYKCKGEVSIKLNGKEENGYTKWIYFDPKDSISIAHCFEQHLEQSWLASTLSALKKAKAFWRSIAGGGRIDNDRIIPMKGEEPIPDEDKLLFLETDHFRFLYRDDFQIDFKIKKQFPVKSIHIIDKNDELVFYAGDTSLIEGYFQIDTAQVAELTQSLTSMQSEEEEELAYQLSIKNIQTQLLQGLVLGQWYELGIELENQQTKPDIYTFSFRFFTEEELQQLISFTND